MPHTPDILILGGGLAGSAAAIHLARAGRSVTLIDREPTPKHKVCGEFLSAEALHLLHHLGLNLNPSPETRPSHSHPIRTVRLASRHHLTEAQLPFPAQSLTRRCLDPLLLHTAEQSGAQILRGQALENLTHQTDRWHATLNTGRTLTAPQVVLATGKHDLRGFPRPGGPQGDLVALKMYFRLAPDQTTALQHAVELLLHPHGYTGLQLVEDGTANLTALVRRAHLSQLGGWPGLLDELGRTNPHAAQRLQNATPLLDKPLALSGIPYGFVRRHALAPTLYTVGDQAAVIPSFTGDGMSIALYTGLRAAEAILANEPATLFQPELHRQLRGQVARATALSRALIHPASRPLLTTAAHVWPGMMRHVARLTRLPEDATHRYPSV